MFMQWVEGRLLPTFEALYGQGTPLGGATGKKMILIMVCTQCMSFSVLFLFLHAHAPLML